VRIVGAQHGIELFGIGDLLEQLGFGILPQLIQPRGRNLKMEEAVFARDVYVVIGAIMASTAFLVAGMFLADVMLAISDPRIRMIER